MDKVKVAFTAYLLVAVLMLAGLTGCHRITPPAAPDAPSVEPVSQNGTVDDQMFELKLHFITNGYEEVERRPVPFTLGLARAAILELAKGKLDGAGDQKILPPGTRLIDIEILDSIAYVDFSREFRDNHWGGLASELDTIYSIVNTLAEFNTVRRVQFLLEGSPIDTIGAGIVDLSEPVHPLPIEPEHYAQISLELASSKEQTLPWSSLVGWEQRIGFRNGLPEKILAVDTDGDGSDELIVTTDKEISIWKYREGTFTRVWTRRFSSSPRASVLSAEGGKLKHLIIGTGEGLYVFAWDKNDYQQIAWHGVGGTLIDLATGDTNGNEKGQILALIGSRGSESAGAESSRIIIWEWNGETYIMKREVNFNAQKILLSDLTGDGIDELLAFGRDGLTVFSWQSAAYVEIAENPSADVELSFVLTADLTGDGQSEILIRDGQSPYLYVYAWRQGALRKLWQGAPADVTLGREMFVATETGGKVSLIMSTLEPGRYVVYQPHEDGWEQEMIAGINGEEILAVGDVDGDGQVNIVFRRLQLLSSPTKWIYIGWPGA